MAEPRKAAVLIELDGAAEQTPATAPPVPDSDVPTGAMMLRVADFARPRNGLGRFFWATFSSLAGFVLSLLAWDFVMGLFARNSLLGTVAVVLLALFLLASALIALREVAAFARLRRLDEIRLAAIAASAAGDLAAARLVVGRVTALFAARPELQAGIARLEARKGDLFDADGLLGLAETEVLASADRAAVAQVEQAARRVALVTAFVPLALADVVTALVANLGMIRKIAEIYGGRSGTLGSWRLVRTVLTHLAATGALAVGDDLIHSVAGGGLLSKLSRRFGEGVVNGALTARVGVAAIDVCRPLPYHAVPRPKVSALVQRALTGVFGAAG